MNQTDIYDIHLSEAIMDVCANRLCHSCWGCPFKGKAPRSKTCRDWILVNKDKAEKMANKFIKNGYGLYNKNNPPYVGRIDKDHVRQICPRCDHISVLKNSEVYKDDYIGKWMWTCPHCHHDWKLMKSKKMSADLDASKGGTV